MVFFIIEGIDNEVFFMVSVLVIFLMMFLVYLVYNLNVMNCIVIEYVFELNILLDFN